MVGDEYKRRAVECLKLAEQVADQSSKAKLTDMAAAWLRLAEQAEKNSRAFLVYEPPYIERVKP
jgi:hypothetical protein